jgi:hypothetical protein
MRIRSAVLMSLLALSLAATPAVSNSHRQVHRVGINIARGIGPWLRANGYDVAGVRKAQREVEVITDDAGLAKLRAYGINPRMIESRVEGLQNTPPDSRYLDPAKVAAHLTQLAQTYPAVTRLEQIGTSLQGRPIEAILISTTPKAGDPQALTKPSIMFDGMHHAREIMTPEVVSDIADTLLAGYASQDPATVKLVNAMNIWVIPMLNVDGNNIVWTSDNWWRKNAAKQGADVVGVDINRNYPFHWAICNGSSTDPSADDYHGPSAASEPETKAYVAFADQIRPVASISYHSFSELVLYPYGCTNTFTPENALEQKVGAELAALLPNDTGGGNYTPGTPWQTLYAVDGDSMSYLFGAYGTLSYVFEINEEFQPSYDLRAPTLVKQRKAWTYFLQRVDGNLLTLQVQDMKTGRLTPATLSVSTIQHQQGEKDFQTNEAGFFHKVLDPGTYTIIATLPNGRQGVTTVTMAGQKQSQTIQIQ